MSFRTLSLASQDHRQAVRGLMRDHSTAYMTPFVAGVMALIVYLLTLAPDLTWAHYGSDGAELITAAVTLGVPHPPGYPTYVLLGKLISLFPLGTVAWRFNFFSALAAAVAAAFVTAVAWETAPPRSRRALIALSTGMAVALAPLVWSQAVIAEVYVLNLAFVATFLWLLLGRRLSWLSGLFLGLSVTTHLTSLLLLPLAMMVVSRRRHLLAGFLLGLLPLVALPLLAAGDSPVMWGNPGDLAGLWWLASGRLYAANLQVPTWSSLIARAPSLTTALFGGAGWLIWLGIVAGVAGNPLPRTWRLGLLFSAALYGIYGICYGTDDAAVMMLPVLLLLSPFLAAGLARVPALAPVLPLILLVSGFAHHDLRQEREIRPLAQAVLQAVPEGAVLLTPGDPSIFTLWYFQHVEQQRPDIVLADANLLAFDWYRQNLARHYPDLEALDEDDLALFEARNARGRPFCTLSPGLAAVDCALPETEAERR